MTESKVHLLARRWTGLLAVLLVFVPVMVYRAAQETSLWIDEVYTIQLVQKSVPQIIDATSVDAHPPLHYLLLHGWRSLWMPIFGEGILLIRSFNVLIGILFIILVWFGTRQIMRKNDAAITTWTIMIGPGILQMVKESRSYALAACALAACFFLMLILLMGKHGADRTKKGSIILWILYAALASLAIWSHYLTGFALAIMGAVWLILSCKRKPIDRREVILGLCANVLVFLLILPLLLAITRQVSHVQIQGQWSTIPSVWNLLGVFAFWYPFGRVGAPVLPGFLFHVLAGIVTFAVPLLCILYAIKKRNKSIEHEPYLLVAGMSTVVCVGFNIALWSIDRFTSLQLFHGPRYPMLVLSMWGVSLASLALFATSALGKSRRFTLLILAPWFILSIIGHGWVITVEKNRGLYLWLEGEGSALLPASDEPLYVYPDSLLPYFANSLESYDAQPVEELLESENTYSQATFLNLSFWENLFTPEDVLIAAFVREKILSEEVLTLDGPEYELHLLKNLRAETIDELADTGFTPLLERVPSNAVSVALPFEQRRRHGWSILEVRPNREFMRWSNAERTPIVFQDPVPAGKYRLHVHGMRPDVEIARGEMTLNLEGSAKTVNINPPPGTFEFSYEVTVTDKLERPTLWVTHPIWTQHEAGIREGDMRTYSFVFLAAWLEKTDLNGAE